MAASGLGADAGDPLPVGYPLALLRSSLAPALSTQPVSASYPVALHLPPADWLHGVVSYAVCALHPVLQA